MAVKSSEIGSYEVVELDADDGKPVYFNGYLYANLKDWLYDRKLSEWDVSHLSEADRRAIAWYLLHGRLLADS